MGSKIYPKVHENPRAFFSSSSPSLLESSIQYPWGVGLHHSDGREEEDVQSFESENLTLIVIKFKRFLKKDEGKKLLT